MKTTYEFDTEDQARTFWHHLLEQMGFDRMAASCSVARESGGYVVTVMVGV